MNRLFKAVKPLALAYKESAKKKDFLDGCPKLQSFQEVKKVLDSLTLDDLGLKDKINHEFFSKGKDMKYIQIAEAEDVSCGIFAFPKGKGFDFHDHPNMLVFSKVLYGRIRHRSYDLDDLPKQTELQNIFYGREKSPQDFIGTMCQDLTATMKENHILEANGPGTYLLPTQGNIHKFHPLEESLLLDLLIPGYDFVERYCNFYDEKVQASKNGEKGVLQYNIYPVLQDCDSIPFNEFATRPPGGGCS